MKPGDIKLRGDRSSIPEGFLLGRLSKGSGPVELVSFQQLQAAGIVPSGMRPIGPAGGDLGGTYPDPLVTGIQGIPVTDDTPADGDILIYDQGTNTWTVGTITAGDAVSSFFIDGDGNYYVAMVNSVADPRLILDSGGLPVYVKNPAFNIAAGDLALTTNHILVGDASNIATDVAMSGDGTIVASGAITITKTGGVSFAPSATTDTTNAANITSGTLPNARIVALPNANLANSSVTISGHALALGGSLNLAAGDVSGLAAIATSGSASDLGTGTIPNARIVALPNANLANSAITLNGHSVSLGGTLTLAPGDLALTNAHIFVGNGSNVAADVAMSGDATLANTGALTIAALAVTNAKLADEVRAAMMARVSIGF